MSTHESKLANKIVEDYLQKEDTELSENGRIFRAEIMAREEMLGYKSQKNESFRKQIVRVEKIFKSNKNKNEDLPKPVLLIDQYDFDEQKKFYESYFEQMMSGSDGDYKQKFRKINNNLNEKMDLNQDYQFVMNIVRALEPNKEYPELSELLGNENMRKHQSNRSDLREIAYASVNIAQTMGPDLVIDDFCRYPKLKKIWDKNSERVDLFFIYLLSIASGWWNIEESIKTEYFKHDICIYQNRYYSMWNLAIFVFMHSFQQLGQDEELLKAQSKNMPYILNELEQIGLYEDDQDISEAKLADDYYRYNQLLKYRSVLWEENKYYTIKNSDFKDLIDNGKIKENVSEYSDAELMNLFHIGADEKDAVTLRTFKERLSHCRKFIPAYNKISNRKILANNTHQLRAVYRALYINKVSYMRVQSDKMAEKLFNYYEMNEKNDKNNLPDNCGNNTNIMKYHYVIGMQISSELMLETPNGKERLTNKEKFGEGLYKAMLRILYHDFPRIGDSENEFDKKLDNLSNYFEKIIDLIYS